MELKIIDKDFVVCKVKDYSLINLDAPYYFIGKTDEEFSLVCDSNSVPENVMEQETGWRAFRIEGTLDFSLTGILSKISAALAENRIGIFAISTFNTDYILVKDHNLSLAVDILQKTGYVFVK